MHISDIVRQTVPDVFVHVARGRGSVVFWLRCNYVFSGLVFDVMLIYQHCGGMTLPQQHRCNAVHGITPLLRVAVVASCPRRRRVLRLDESFLQGVPRAEYAIRYFLICCCDVK